MPILINYVPWLMAILITNSSEKDNILDIYSKILYDYQNE